MNRIIVVGIVTAGLIIDILLTFLRNYENHSVNYMKRNSLIPDDGGSTHL
jgi:hypothetical protein